MFAMAAGVRVPDEPTRRDLQRILEATKHTPAARAIHFAVLKTLAKASYSPALVGHFALASDHYAHFTSPIRRYPDLSLHRTVDAYLDATDNGRSAPGGKKRRELGQRILEDSRSTDEGQLIELGRHCSETEIEAELAERELREFLVLQFLHEKHLGDEFEGVITGVTSSGFWVSLDRFLVEGKVAFQEIPGADGRSDRWNVDPATGRARAQRSGAVLAVGDIVTAQVVRIDLASRHLDLAIAKMPQRRAQDDGEAAGELRGRRSDAAGSRWGASMKRSGKTKKHRKGYKQGRRGRRSR